MSSSALAAAEFRAIERAKAALRKTWDVLLHAGSPVSDAEKELTYLQLETRERDRTAAIMVRAEELRKAQAKLRPPSDRQDGDHWYFLTIRPDSETTLQSLKHCIEDMLKRSCFIAATYTFEQKGVTKETLGFGHHTHIIANMKQRSKAEVARDIRSTLSRCNIRAIVQVDGLRTDADIRRVTAYIVDYESNDGHKVLTQQCDAEWRIAQGLQATYSK